MRILFDPQDGDPTGGGMAAMMAGGDGQSAPTPPKPQPISVPLSFLAQPDDQEQMQTPAKGDTGSMTVDYTVLDIQGDNALVQPSAVNGNDLGADQAETPDPDAQEGSDLQAMAGQMSQGQ